MLRPQLEFHEIRVPSPPVRYAVSTNSISIYCLVCDSVIYFDVFASMRIASYHSSYSDRIVKIAVRQIAFSTPEQTSNLSSLYQESPNMLSHGSSLCSFSSLFSFCAFQLLLMISEVFSQLSCKTLYRIRQCSFQLFRSQIQFVHV